MDDTITMGIGRGKSKKEAEQNAAKVTLDLLVVPKDVIPEMEG
jgi:dsRNA-specific ribonuclease